MRRLGACAMLAVLALVASVLPAINAASARSSFKDHEAWAAEHIDSLPSEIRTRVKALGRVCGVMPAAAHGFAVQISNGRFMVLHYEALWCPRRELVCKGDSCLHEVYAQSSRGYTRLYSGFVTDEALFPGRGNVGLNLFEDLRWDGRRFLPEQ